MSIFFLILNFLIILFLTVSFYPVIGVTYTIISIIITLTCYNNKKIASFLISLQIKKWNIDLIDNDKDGKMLLLSAAFLAIAIKVDAAIAIFIYGGAIFLIAFAILLATGFFFLGYASGMTITGATVIAKWLVKAYVLSNSLVSKIVEIVIEIEFSILGIEKK